MRRFEALTSSLLIAALTLLSPPEWAFAKRVQEYTLSDTSDIVLCRGKFAGIENGMAFHALEQTCDGSSCNPPRGMSGYFSVFTTKAGNLTTIISKYELVFGRTLQVLEPCEPAPRPDQPLFEVRMSGGREISRREKVTFCEFPEPPEPAWLHISGEFRLDDQTELFNCRILLKYSDTEISESPREIE